MNKMPKKVYRSEDNYILAGVCGGLGDYFEIDPTLVRVIFVLLAIGGGAGILIYILLALIIPKKGTFSTKKNVEEVTEEIENKVKNISKEIRENKRFNVFGLILILLGGIFLWNTFGFFKINGEILWPAILIVLGFSILFK